MLFADCINWLLFLNNPLPSTRTDFLRSLSESTPVSIALDTLTWDFPSLYNDKVLHSALFIATHLLTLQHTLEGFSFSSYFHTANASFSDKTDLIVTNMLLKAIPFELSLDMAEYYLDRVERGLVDDEDVFCEVCCRG